MNMLLFATVALCVYTAMHCLVFRGVYPLLAGNRCLVATVVLWMLMMIAAPVAVRFLEGAGSPQAARLLAQTGYTWMGLVFLAFSMFAVLGVVELLYRLLLFALPQLPHPPRQGRIITMAVLLVTLAVGMHGCREAKKIRVVTVPLTTHKLPPGTNTLRVVQVSDVHLGLLNGRTFLEPVIAMLRELAPDLLVATGDVVDAQINHLDGLGALWREIAPPLGKFAVLGNHEAYVGLGQSLDFLYRSGFVVLRNTGVTIGGGIRLVGIDDDRILARTVHEKALLQANNSEFFTIFLKHRPTVNEDSEKLFDLQLSGHAHRGQIFPFNFLTGIRYPMQDGLYRLSSGSWLYANRGTGTWGPPMRVLSPPEITLFEISRPAEN